MKRIFPDYFILNVVFGKGVREVWETFLKLIIYFLFHIKWHSHN